MYLIQKLQKLEIKTKTKSNQYTNLRVQATILKPRFGSTLGITEHKQIFHFRWGKRSEEKIGI